MDSNDRLVARLAARQRGLITRLQLLDCGVSSSAIARRVAADRLHRVFRGVYLVGHPVPPPLAQELAALLAVAPGGVLSHHTAAQLWGVLPGKAVVPEIHVTVPGRRCRRQPGLHPHAGTLAPHDIRTRDGLRLTSPQRTLRDLIPVLDPAALELAADEAELRRLVPRRPGAMPSRSEAERRLLALLRRAGLPPTATNTKIRGYEVDALYAEDRVIVEMDGYAFHRDRRAFERDHERDTGLTAAGYVVLRVTWRQLVGRPESIVASVARALGP